VIYIVAAAAVVCAVAWAGRELIAVRREPRRAPYAAYMVTHIAIFTTGYLLIDDINNGWLVLNIWHNVQYLLIVWMFNANRFKRGIDQQHRLLSTISQPQNVWMYVGTSLAAATFMYLNVQKGVGLLAPSNVLPASFAVYMIINFHHYVVDTIIWRRPRRPSAVALPV
jgi:hypothetical protein